MPTIRERREESRVLSVDSVAEALQFQIAHYFFLHQAGEIGRRGDSVAGPDFFRDSATAHEFTRFEHQDLDSGTSQVRGCHQPVVASADDDGLERSQFGSLYARYSAGKPAAPTATTTYCLPFSMYVIGEPVCPAGMGTAPASCPVFLSYARRYAPFLPSGMVMVPGSPPITRVLVTMRPAIPARPVRGMVSPFRAG